mgnify:CR=1 FL=1
MPSGWASACTTHLWPGHRHLCHHCLYHPDGFDLRTAGGNAKVLNLASNYASLVTYLSGGLVVFSIGIPCAISGIVGNLLGSHFALKNGAKFIRPMMLVVLVLLLARSSRTRCCEPTKKRNCREQSSHKTVFAKVPKWGRFGVTSVTPFLLRPVHPKGRTPAHRT